jgi:glycosyl transferase family 25
MEEQLEGAGLSHEFVEAVDGWALTRSERAPLVDEAAVARFPDWLTPQMIGCSLSHLRVYEKIVASGDETGLVLEDDVTLPGGIAETAAEVASHMTGSEVVLLYFRSFGDCGLSAHDSVPLHGGKQLLYPIHVGQLVTTAAYLITAEACRRLVEIVLPIHAAPDSWGEFYERGAIQSLRCVLPRPVAIRKDFKSTITRPTTTPLGRTTDFIARHRIFPLFQVLTLNRNLIERRMSRMKVVPEQSPVARARSATTA